MNINFKWALSSWKSFKVSLGHSPTIKQQLFHAFYLFLKPISHWYQNLIHFSEKNEATSPSNLAQNRMHLFLGLLVYGKHVHPCKDQHFHMCWLDFIPPVLAPPVVSSFIHIFKLSFSNGSFFFFLAVPCRKAPSANQQTTREFP